MKIRYNKYGKGLSKKAVCKTGRKDTGRMFGYIRVFTPELRVSEYEAYKSAYCGFCKRLGKDYGQFWRLTLSYDFAFAKLLSEALHKEKLTACRERCAVHPFRKRYCMRSRESDRMLSASAVLLVDAKIKDNLADSRWYTKWAWKLVSLIVRPSVKRAAKDFPWLKKQTDLLTENQQKAEQNPKVTKDAAADPTGTLMAAYFEALSEDAAQRRVLHQLGYQLGRYVYFTDALDDLKKDHKSGAFNPFLLNAREEWDEKRLSEIREGAVQTINRCIGGAIAAYELLDLYHMKPILDNVLYFGLQRTVKGIAAGKRPIPENEMEIN